MSLNTRIEEIRPNTLNKVIFSDDLCKLSFNVFTHNKPVELLYNPKRNMFNATKLIQFAINLASGNFPRSNKHSDESSLNTNDSDISDLRLFPEVIESDKSVQNTSSNRILEYWFRDVDNIEFIDQVSLRLTGEYHFSYDGKPIWNDDGTIIKNVLDSHGRVQVSKLTHLDDNILVKINAGNTPVSGTWLNYEFLPEMLRISSMDYRVLANHFQAALLPFLTNHNISFEQQVIQQQYQCLVEQEILDEIDLEQKPVFKGSKTEKYCAELFKKVFETDPDFEDVSIVSHEKHTCDIRLKRERLLVEVKMVKSSPRPGDDKFIRDLKENANSIAAGIYINFGNNTMSTHFEFNPFRIYLNRKDFNESYLIFIRDSFSDYNHVPSIAEQMNPSSQAESSKQLAINTEISSSIIRKGTLYFSDALLAIISNLKADSRLSEYINKTDLVDRQKVLQNIQRGEDMNDFDQYIKEFLAIHLSDFEKGFLQEEAKNLFEEYLISKGVDCMKDSDIAQLLNSYTKLIRASVAGRQRKYTIKKGLIDEINKIDVSKIDVNNLITLEEAISKGLTSPEQSIKDFLQLEEIEQFMSNPNGCLSSELSSKYRDYVYSEIQPKNYNITISRFMQHYYDYMAEHYGQLAGKTNKNKYMSFNNPIAKQSLKEFDDCVKHELSTNKNASYDSIMKIYDSLNTVTPKLTKTTTLPRFRTLKGV